MKIMVINQEPIIVTLDQGKELVQQIANGAEMILVGNEMIKASAITGIRNDENDFMPKRNWGQLASGQMQHFLADNREKASKGYEKYKRMRQELGL